MPIARIIAKASLLTMFALVGSGTASAKDPPIAMSAPQAVETLQGIINSTPIQLSYFIDNQGSDIDAMYDEFEKLRSCGSRCGLIPARLLDANTEFIYISSGDGTSITDIPIPLSDTSVYHKKSVFMMLKDHSTNRSFFLALKSGSKNAETISSALEALSNGATERSKRWATEFPAVAENYRAMNPKPAATEDIHKVDVTARDAIQGKRFLAADDDFAQGIDANPWWPPFHYNRALVLAGLGVYSEAAVEMQRYLALAPMRPTHGTPRTRSTRGKQKRTERSDQWATVLWWHVRAQRSRSNPINSCPTALREEPECRA